MYERRSRQRVQPSLPKSNITKMLDNGNSTKLTDQQISVLRVTPSNTGNNLLAYINVRIGLLTILGFRLFRNKKGGHFVRAPSKQSGDQYYPVVTIDEPLKSQIDKAVLQASESIRNETS